MPNFYNKYPQEFIRIFKLPLQRILIIGLKKIIQIYLIVQIRIATAIPFAKCKLN